MSNKLTKNDSMCKGAQDFKTIVAAFEATISRNGVWLDYFAAWCREKELRYGYTLYQQWLDWARVRNPRRWVIAAFYFDEQYIPEQVWHNINKEWYRWISENLNK